MKSCAKCGATIRESYTLCFECYAKENEDKQTLVCVTYLQKLGENERALRVVLAGDRKMWFPKEQIIVDCRATRRLWIRRWLAEKKGVGGYGR